MVKPYVPNQAVRRRMSPRRKRDMPHHSFRIGVRMMCVLKDDAPLVKIAEPALAHAVNESPRQITTKLIDRDLQD